MWAKVTLGLVLPVLMLCLWEQKCFPVGGKPCCGVQDAAAELLLPWVAQPLHAMGTLRPTDGKAEGPLPSCLGFLWTHTDRGWAAPDQDECCHPNQQGLAKSIMRKGGKKRQPRNDSGGFIIIPGGCYCSEKGINMQPVVQELPTLHGCGGQEKTTERNVG